MKMKLMVDSTSQIPLEYLQKNKTSVLEINVAVNGEMKKELSEVDINKFMEIFPSLEPFPTTSFASPHQALELFEEIIEEGHKEILYPFMTPKISNQVNSVRIASKRVSDKLKIHYYPTQLAGPSQAPFIFTANQMLEENKTIDEIFKQFDTIKNLIYTIGFSNDFENLFKSGKIKRTLPISLATTLFKIKPIYKVKLDEGVLGFGGGLGYEGAIRNMVSEIRKKTSIEVDYNLIILHSGAPELAEKLERKIKNTLEINETFHWQISSAIIVSVGIGAVMAAVFPIM